MHLQAAVEHIRKHAKGLRRNVKCHLSSLRWHTAGSLPLHWLVHAGTGCATTFTWPLWGFHHHEWHHRLAFLCCESTRMDTCLGTLLGWKVKSRAFCSMSATVISNPTARGLVASSVTKPITTYICRGEATDRKLQIKICEVHLQEHIPGSRRLLWCWKILGRIWTDSKNVHSDFDLPTEMLTDPRVGESTQVECRVQDTSLTNWSETTEVQQTVSITLEWLTSKERSWSPSLPA